MKVYRILVALAILGFAKAAEADYVIHFRNGNEVVVGSYKEAGDQIRYRRFGGTLSVPKSGVAVIENRETGEKQVLNPYYSEKETRAIRKGQATRLDEHILRQEVRDHLMREPDPVEEKPKEKPEESGTKEKSRESTRDRCGPFGCENMARCMVTGEGSVYRAGPGSAWSRMSQYERLQACERARESSPDRWE